MKLSLLGVGLLGPGLANWESGRALLHTPSAWHRAATVVPAPERLPATERRRAGDLVKASIVVAGQALAASGLDPTTLPTVFASSSGETHNCHILFEALATPERLVSPTRFTNSVHNTPAGYWHIATRSRAPSTSLAAFDASFAAGLLEAAAQCLCSQGPVLLVACDLPYPEPLYATRPLPDLFATALVLTAAGRGRGLELQIAPPAQASRCAHAALETLARQIPAARALPLLCALAGAGAAELVLEGPGGVALRVGVLAA